jgi:hypothetical protein
MLQRTGGRQQLMVFNTICILSICVFCVYEIQVVLIILLTKHLSESGKWHGFRTFTVKNKPEKIYLISFSLTTFLNLGNGPYQNIIKVDI